VMFSRRTETEASEFARNLGLDLYAAIHLLPTLTEEEKERQVRI
jgi:hypothetical protein